MRIIDLETINQAMDNETQFVLRCEEVFHDKVSSAAAAILSAGRDRRIVALTGPSGSGKTTTAMRLREYLENLGVKVCLLSMDNFFLPLDQRPPEATDWESPYCVNVEQLVGCIGRLLDGEEADIPWYDFKTGTTGGYNKMQGNRDCVVIAEGIHMLNPLIFDKLRGAATGIYVAPRTRILTNKDRVVRPEQLRVARRLIRDYNTRGHSLRDGGACRERQRRRGQLHPAVQGQRVHPYRLLPRLRGVHSGQISGQHPRFPAAADAGIHGGAQAHRPDRGGAERSAAAHALCAAELHHPRVRGRQLLSVLRGGIPL